MKPFQILEYMNVYLFLPLNDKIINMYKSNLKSNVNEKCL